MKYDVYFRQHYPFRILQNVTREAIDAYCAANGYRVVSESRRGLSCSDAYIAKEKQ